MNKTEIILIIMFVIIELQLIWYRYKPLYKKARKAKKEELLKSLVNKQKEDELVVEKDKDITIIDEYVKYIGKILERYNNPKNLKIAYRTRQELLYRTIKILPIIAKHITLNYYYNLDDKEWYRLTDRDMLMLLESSYNDYTHDNLDSLNSIITAVLRLRDDRR